jgi:hypothetical protein
LPRFCSRITFSTFFCACFEYFAIALLFNYSRAKFIPGFSQSLCCRRSAQRHNVA